MFKEKLKKRNNKKGKSDRAVVLPCGVVLCTYIYYRANVIPVCSVFLAESRCFGDETYSGYSWKHESRKTKCWF